MKTIHDENALENEITSTAWLKNLRYKFNGKGTKFLRYYYCKLQPKMLTHHSKPRASN